MQFNTDCRYWRGDKPCKENRLCEGCGAYTKLGLKILLIKVGARGDVMRTTPLVAGLKKKYPESHLTWLTAPESEELLRDLPGLDELRVFKIENLMEILARCFDLVICLDKEPGITGLAERVKAGRKQGWGMAPNGTGTPRAFNPEAEYSLALGVYDELKFQQNQKTYLQIIFEALGLEYAGEPYVFQLTAEDRKSCQVFFRRSGIEKEKNILGLFTGCGRAWPRKRWTEEWFARLAERARQELNAEVLLLGGPKEREINERIQRLAGVPLLDTRGEHTLREFAGFLEVCRPIVTGDTLALHMALALQRPTLALFGPTSGREIEMFRRGEKIVSQMPCSPCYRPECDKSPDCMQNITLDEVWPALIRLWNSPA